ncbi:hypothetical protein ACFYSF_22645 [Streptomyces canus]|uniref:hypothetical protein n=1 Tax=Streptomyces canus TaxID=58343 RepID=UPI0036AAB81A
MDGLRETLDIVQPRTLVRDFFTGSWILVKLLWGLLVRAWRAASTKRSPEAAPKVDLQKTGEAPEESDGEQPAPADAKAKASGAVRSGAALVEQILIGGLIVVVATGGLGVVGSVALYFLNPYLKTIGTVSGMVLTTSWAIAALVLGAADRPANDHEKSAGEQPQGEASDEAVEAPPAPEAWEIVQKRLLVFVEQRVAAGAAGHTEGVKGRGASVDDLLAEQQENGGLPGMGRQGMIALLEEAGITVREQMKFRVLEETPSGPKWKQRNIPGVHVEDLTHDLKRPPRLPPHLVPAIDPSGTPISPPDPARIPAENYPTIPAQDEAQIPAARAAGE